MAERKQIKQTTPGNKGKLGEKQWCGGPGVPGYPCPQPLVSPPHPHRVLCQATGRPANNGARKSRGRNIRLFLPSYPHSYLPSPHPFLLTISTTREHWGFADSRSQPGRVFSKNMGPRALLPDGLLNIGQDGQQTKVDSENRPSRLLLTSHGLLGYTFG